MFTKILIANRGEIACRIIKTAQRLGIKCVAIYSEADLNARHVTLADEAFLLGPSPSEQSYLCAEKIIKICKQSAVQAVHPGYGFLSENTQFAEALAANDICFIGPPSSAIAAMGSKSVAKEIMEKANVPIVPGYHSANQEPKQLKQASIECGYPQLLKAVAGGGGKGMRIVKSADEFDAALNSTRREAQKAFGNTDMLIERYLTQTRHVEVQVFCDQQGQGIYLAERDCSLQRRHQKVIEEAPAPDLSDQTRKIIGETAVRAAQAIDYVGAGTVEFLYNPDGTFYFMEMNTRLQVEHPITEMITDLDLVEWQLRIAFGETLPLTQDQLKINGHALEARIYAEDPDNDFLPATGRLKYLSTPEENDYLRIDTGVIQNDDISIYYDPMIAKLITWGETREAAINRMVNALREYRIAGVKTNTRFLLQLVNSLPFRKQQINTDFIETHHELLFTQQRQDRHWFLAIAATYFLQRHQQADTIKGDQYSPFNQRNNWRLNRVEPYATKIVTDQETYEIEVIVEPDGYNITVDQTSYAISATLIEDRISLNIEGQQLTVHYFEDNDQLTLFYQGEQFQCQRPSLALNELDTAVDGALKAPMNGIIVAIGVEKEQQVKQGDCLIIMEAMKMEHSITAPCDSVVKNIYFAQGDQVNEGSRLIELESQALNLTSLEDTDEKVNR